MAVHVSTILDPAQTSELGGVTTHNTVLMNSNVPAQTSELGGVTTLQNRRSCISLRLHRPLSSEGLRQVIKCPNINNLPAQTSELGGVTTISFCCSNNSYSPAQTSELGGVTTQCLPVEFGTFQPPVFTGGLFFCAFCAGLRVRPLSSFFFRCRNFFRCCEKSASGFESTGMRGRGETR